MKPERKAAAVRLGAAIRKQRKALGLTQQDLGRFAGCGLAFIYALETGKPTVRLDKLQDVLEVLGMQIHLTPGKSGLSIDERLK